MAWRCTRLDPNREVNEAAQGNAEAVQAYETFHGFIETASEAVGRGVLFDLHGQSHEQNSTECGYLVRTEDLNSGNYRFGLVVENNGTDWSMTSLFTAPRRRACAPWPTRPG